MPGLEHLIDDRLPFMRGKGTAITGYNHQGWVYVAKTLETFIFRQILVHKIKFGKNSSP
jgi:hypothetical protein